MRAAAEPLEVAVTSLADSDREAAVQTLARAFRDNPLNVAVIGPDPARRLRSNLHGTRALLPVAQAHGEAWVARAGGRVVAALVGTRPFGYPLPPPPLRARLRCLLGQGLGVARRWAEVFAALDALHPTEPHWYLGTLGVDPDDRSRGVGSRLAERWLGRADAEAAPVYLETDRAANVPFYERLGFAVEREAEILGIPVWCMRRAEALPR